MTKLFSCKAKCDQFNLISYNTQIISVDKRVLNIHLVHSMTTMYHVRKYIEWLRLHNNNWLADAVQLLYRYCIDYKKVDATYDLNTGVLA